MRHGAKESSEVKAFKRLCCIQNVLSMTLFALALMMVACVMHSLQVQEITEIVVLHYISCPVQIEQQCDAQS